MVFPKLEFVELEDKTENGLVEYIDRTGYGFFLVYVRQKYKGEWECSTKPLECFDDYMHWLFDWDNGQDCEYLGICRVR